LAGLFALLLLTALWSWWALAEGGYFVDVMLPGAVLLCAGLIVLVLTARSQLELRRSPAACAALVALLALGAWSALSAAWSPAPDIAITDGQRIATYGLSFGAGIWLCNLLGTRMILALVPLAVAGAIAGLVTVGALLLGDSPRELLESDATLDYPLGYRNAAAAFFAVSMLAALGLAAERSLDWRARGPALASSTLSASMFLICQSRGSVPALAAALLVLTLLAPLRLRTLAWLVLAVAPALLILSPDAALYRTGASEGLRAVVPELRAVGAAAAAAAGIGLVLGLLAARYERRLPALGSATPAANHWVALALAALATGALVLFTATVGSPVGFVDDKIDEFETAGTPDLSERSNRFSFSTGSGRYDLWRVAVEKAADEPLLGTGGGGYEHAYLREREVASQQARDAHSVELEVLSELGLPGLALLAAGIAGAALGAFRARRLGPSAAGLSAFAVAIGTYWLLHSSVDWFWVYPAITAPVLALLGSACAPTMLAAGARPPRRTRRWPMVAALVAFALTAIPPLLSQRYVDRAYETWREQPERAYEDLDRAATLNPLTDSPILAEGAIALAAGDEERALAAFREAVERRPQTWAAHHLIAKLLADTNRAAAAEAIRAAQELNPLSERVRALAEKVGG